MRKTQPKIVKLGRPFKKPEHLFSKVSISIPQQLMAQAREIRDATGKSVSQQTREAMDLYYAHHAAAAKDPVPGGDGKGGPTKKATLLSLHPKKESKRKA